MTPGRRAIRVLAIVSLAGCAPLASFRPASSPTGFRNELGAGAAIITPRPFVTEPIEGAGQLWGTRRVSRRFALSIITAFDDSAVAAGVGVLFLPIRTRRFAAGMSVEGGFAWGATGIPLALRLGQGVWLYASPRIGNYGDVWTPAIPVGLSIPFTARAELRAEAGPSWADLSPNNRRFVLGLALAYKLQRIDR